MASEVGMRVAETILEDRKNEGDFQDAEPLSHYLLGSYAPGSGLYEESRRVAETVLAKLAEESAGEETTALAEYIDEEMGAVRDKATDG